MSSWKKLESEIVHKNPYFKVTKDKVKKPNGNGGEYFSLNLPPCVIIVPLTNDNCVYFIRTERYTTNLTHYELPHGSSDNEDVLVAAKRELQEESGLVSKNWEEIGIQEVANGWTGQLSYVFIAKNVTKTDLNQKASEGITQIKKVTLKNALEMIGNGEITESNSIAALTLAAVKLKII